MSTFINPIVSKSENFYKPYRLFFGFKQQITNFYTDLSLEDRNLSDYENILNDQTGICFKRRPNHKDYLIGGFNGEACRKKNDADYGYDAMPEPPTFSYANIEFVPQYITENIGYYIFVSDRKIYFSLVDYPIKD